LLVLALLLSTALSFVGEYPTCPPLHLASLSRSRAERAPYFIFVAPPQIIGAIPCPHRLACVPLAPSFLVLADKARADDAAAAEAGDDVTAQPHIHCAAPTHSCFACSRHSHFCMPQPPLIPCVPPLILSVTPAAPLPARASSLFRPHAHSTSRVVLCLGVCWQEDNMGAEEEVDVESVSATQPKPLSSSPFLWHVYCHGFSEKQRVKDATALPWRVADSCTPPENSCVPASTTVNAPFYFALRWAG
jgi:hypothetical protein